MGLQIGCVDPWPGGSAAVSGNFAGPYPTGYLSLTLVESAGIVTGRGWLRTGGPVGPVLVTGTSTPDLQLLLQPDNNADGVVDSGSVARDLSGYVNERGILARLTTPGFPSIDLVLARVDTAATGTYTWTAQGALTLSERGAAGFEPQDRVGLLLPYDPVDNGLRLDIAGGRPPPGEYPIAPYPSPLSATVFHHWKTGGARYWLATTGVLRVAVSTPYALIGSFDFIATTTSGRDTVLVSGTFSAGCMARCQ